jgi:hypothetical protein
MGIWLNPLDTAALESVGEALISILERSDVGSPEAAGVA